MLTKHMALSGERGTGVVIALQGYLLEALLEQKNVVVVSSPHQRLHAACHLLGAETVRPAFERGLDRRDYDFQLIELNLTDWSPAQSLAFLHGMADLIRDKPSWQEALIQSVWIFEHADWLIGHDLEGFCRLLEALDRWGVLGWMDFQQPQWQRVRSALLRLHLRHDLQMMLLGRPSAEDIRA
jgi:hypothetical protein